MLLKRLLVAAIALLCPVLLSAQDPPATAGQPQGSPPFVLAPGVQAVSSPEKAAILETLERYFKGYYALDPDILASTLHPEAVNTGGVGQASLTIARMSGPLEQLRKMRGKVKPPVVNAIRTVIDLFIRGDLADAIVREEYLPPMRGAGTTAYHAYQLYKTGGRWLIVSGVLHANQYEGDTDGRTLDMMGVRPGMTIGEIGAGDGRVTFPLARRVGEGGKVYANDIDEQALAELRAVCEKTGTKNIETLVGKVDDPQFPKGALDLAITAIAYHHFDQPVALLKNLAASLKPGATLVILDPAYDRTGEKDSDRPTTRERVEAEAAEAGYELVAMDASLPRENIFILRLKTGGAAAVPKVTTAPYAPARVGDERTAILAAIETWWQGHDTDDAVLLDKVLARGARSWFEHEGTLQFISSATEIERITSGNRRPAGTRPSPGEKRTVVDFTQHSAVAVVTMLVEIPRNAAPGVQSYTTFQLYKADDWWQIVNLAGWVGQ